PPAKTEDRTFPPFQKPISIQVDRTPGSCGLPGRWKFRLRELPVVIGIGCGDHLGERGQFDLLSRVVPGSPTVEVDNITGNGWCRFWLAGETPNEPERFAVYDGIGGELVGAGCDDLCGAAGWTVNDRRGIAAH